ncbi:competence type IV pilus major pilin ComGC [Staphylococcus sp. NRL 16/872]|uniref:competence type IV pilus major pilin ComGC n=1 Tax=Staphylococcus sp. NRL 16/872 TaxID=2930131 RepID=UPI001FB2FE42|nr:MULTISPECIES: competence type IV pilus major pilin ComGC [unclassified Staphylococcus]MCJ1656279.1 prepilin-type N-terminal cleavage/methylation domain-containing protein [Staphylococcus sp. NRL 21/187]MCJ1668099.1 prepilin-type N-terminal cleavage/methylation domain-containing protein [Staphylococcus sp. NRL 19/737]WEN68300.1 competence type IV pilus major pilin ComGC [Staphylococcus sp. NRL 16/872]
MKNYVKKLKSLKAFTLIEMLLVLLIISVLLILIIPNIAKQTAHIQSTGCDAQVKMVNSQIEAFTLKNNRAPSSIDELVKDGYIKEGQKSCKSGETITINNGEAVAS